MIKLRNLDSEVMAEVDTRVAAAVAELPAGGMPQAQDEAFIIDSNSVPGDVPTGINDVVIVSLDYKTYDAQEDVVRTFAQGSQYGTALMDIRGLGFIDGNGDPAGGLAGSSHPAPNSAMTYLDVDGVFSKRSLRRGQSHGTVISQETNEHGAHILNAVGGNCDLILTPIAQENVEIIEYFYYAAFVDAGTASLRLTGAFFSGGTATGVENKATFLEGGWLKIAVLRFGEGVSKVIVLAESGVTYTTV